MQKLFFRGHIDPRLFRALPCTATVEGGSISIGGMSGYFDGNPYADGVIVYVRMSGYNVVCESEQERNERIERHNRAAIRAVELAQQERREAIEFNESLGIPVDWVPAVKPVLSGLTSTSWGNGLNRRSVIHVRLNQGLVDGRLRREAGQPLCGGDWGKFGEITDGDPGGWVAKVTCKSCLKTAERFK